MTKPQLGWFKWPAPNKQARLPQSPSWMLQFWPSKLGHKGGSYSKLSEIATYELGMMMSKSFFSDTKKTIQDIPPRKTTFPPIEVGKWKLKSSSRPPFSLHGRKRNNLIVSFVPGFVKFSSPRRSVWMMLAAITHIFKILIFGARPREIQPCQLMLKSKTSQKLCFVECFTNPFEKYESKWESSPN